MHLRYPGKYNSRYPVDSRFCLSTGDSICRLAILSVNSQLHLSTRDFVVDSRFHLPTRDSVCQRVRPVSGRHEITSVERPRFNGRGDATELRDEVCADGANKLQLEVVCPQLFVEDLRDGPVVLNVHSFEDERILCFASETGRGASPAPASPS